jgi:hypothetical protein
VKPITLEAIVAYLFDPFFGACRIFDAKAAFLKKLNEIGRRSVGLRVGLVNGLNPYKRRRGLVRFRKPESRAAHCREFYDLDFRMAQVKFLEFTCQNPVWIFAIFLVFRHLRSRFGLKKKG